MLLHGMKSVSFICLMFSFPLCSISVYKASLAIYFFSVLCFSQVPEKQILLSYVVQCGGKKGDLYR